jgi:hypothetical protein
MHTLLKYRISSRLSLGDMAYRLLIVIAHVFDYASTASQLCTLAAQFTRASLTTRSTLIVNVVVHQMNIQ